MQGDWRLGEYWTEQMQWIYFIKGQAHHKDKLQRKTLNPGLHGQAISLCSGNSNTEMKGIQLLKNKENEISQRTRHSGTSKSELSDTQLSYVLYTGC